MFQGCDGGGGRGGAGQIFDSPYSLSAPVPLPSTISLKKVPDSKCHPHMIPRGAVSPAELLQQVVYSFVNQHGQFLVPTLPIVLKFELIVFMYGII